MKAFFIVLCTSVSLLCGCTIGYRLLGAKTGNWTKCTVADSETNRFVVAEIVKSVADRFALQDETEISRARLHLYVASTNGYPIIAAYHEARPDNPSEDIRLSAGPWQGKISATLLQKKWRKKRTRRYTEVQNTLVSEFKERFDTIANIEVYDSIK